MKQKIFVGVLILAMLAFILPSILPSLRSDKKSEITKQSSKDKPSTLPEPKFKDEGDLVLFRGVDTLKRIDIEVADTEAKRSRGLMFRTSLEENQGMFFIFESEVPRSFWMKDTYIPLDLLFLDAEYRVIFIKENAPAYNTRPIECLIPSQYVLEVQSGFVKAQGIRLGDRIQVTPK